VIGWVFLAGAILSEVGGTAALRMATTGVAPRRTWFVVVGAAYVVAFGLLSLALGAGLPLGVAYGTWAAVGVALTALVGRFVFREPFTWLMGLGIVLIMGGVLLVEVGAAH
jgi:small multidrug resistance pump